MLSRLTWFLKLSLTLVVTSSPGAICLWAQPTKPAAFGYRLGTDIASGVEASRLAIIPLGSIEYHGPSGPPLADSIIAEGLAQRLASEPGVSLFPVLSYTHAPAHSAVYQGTLSVRPAVVTMLLEDILESVVNTGFLRILLLNGHDGNIGPARAAISQMTRRHAKTQMMLVNWWETLPTPDVEALQLFTSGNGGHGHGGPLELSVTAVFAPESVKPGLAPDLDALEPLSSVPYYLEKSDTTGWPGYSGKISEISPEKGKVLVDLAVKRIRKLVDQWLTNDSKPGSW